MTLAVVVLCFAPGDRGVAARQADHDDALDSVARLGRRQLLYRAPFLPLDRVEGPTQRRRGAQMDTTTLVARRERALGAGAPLFYDKPLHIVRGEGVLSVRRRQAAATSTCTTTCRASVMPIRTSSRRWRASRATLNVHSRYLHEGIVALAERLAALHGPAIESVVFSCSGTEANEVALRMARGATGKTRHRLHQRHLSRQQRSGRKDDTPGRRPEQRRRRARHSLPREASAARAGRERSPTSRRPISSACAARSAASRTTAWASRR